MSDFHIRNKFTLHGWTMYEIFLFQEGLEEVEKSIKESREIISKTLERNQVSLENLWEHPILTEIVQTIENEYCVKIKNINIDLIPQTANKRINTGTTNQGGNGKFIINIGCKRVVSINGDILVLHDGDLLLFSENNNSILELQKIQSEGTNSIILILNF